MVMTLPELSRICNDIKDHFDKAQSLHEKLLRHGGTMRTMEGFCHKTDDDTSQVSLTLINMPFVQLKGHGHGTQAKLDPRAIAKKTTGPTFAKPKPCFSAWLVRGQRSHHAYLVPVLEPKTKQQEGFEAGSLSYARSQRQAVSSCLAALGSSDQRRLVSLHLQEVVTLT